MRRLGLPAALLLVLVAGPAAHAHERTDREAKLIARLQRPLVEPLLRAGLPDSSGRCRGHSRAWRHVAYQRAALPALLDAAARGDEVRGEAAWVAIEAAFAQQKPDGSFAHAGTMTAIDDARATALWVGDLAHALIVLDQSPLRGWFARRIELLNPRLGRSADWLMARADTLFALDRWSASRSLANAAAFGFAGELDHREPLLAQARRFLAAATALQDTSGALLESGRRDRAAQGSSLLRLHRWALVFPDSSQDAALERAARWLARRVPANGDVGAGSAAGPTASVPSRREAAAGELSLALLLYGLDERPGSAEALAGGRRVAAFATRRR